MIHYSIDLKIIKVAPKLLFLHNVLNSAISRTDIYFFTYLYLVVLILTLYQKKTPVSGLVLHLN